MIRFKNLLPKMLVNKDVIIDICSFEFFFFETYVVLS